MRDRRPHPPAAKAPKHSKTPKQPKAPVRARVKDDLRKKTAAELEARRQRVLKILDGEPPQPANTQRMLRNIEAEQRRRGQPVQGPAHGPEDGTTHVNGPL